LAWGLLPRTRCCWWLSLAAEQPAQHWEEVTDGATQDALRSSRCGAHPLRLRRDFRLGLALCGCIEQCDGTRFFGVDAAIQPAVHATIVTSAIQPAVHATTITSAITPAADLGERDAPLDGADRQ